MGFHSVALSTPKSMDTMKVFLLPLLLAASCSAQSGDVLKELIKDGSLNLCGSGIQPTTCTCADGTNFTPGNGTTKDEVADQLKNRVVSSEENPCGSGNEVTCLCDDGSSYNARDLIEKKECGKSPRNPCTDKSRPVCSCPNGEALEKAGLRSFLQQIAQG